MKRLITIILTTILVIPAFASEDVRDLLVQKFEQTGAALLKFPQGMTPSVETINLNDPRLSNVWGDSIRRISFRTADNAPTKGSYVFNITELY